MKGQLKRMVSVGICVMCLSAAGFAESMYVTDVLKLTLRSGPSTEYKILAVIESGQQVDMLEPGEEWSQVKLANGKEGYVLSRYLLPNPTHNVRLEQLQIKHKAVMQQSAALLEENTLLKDENKKLKSSLQGNEKMLEDLDNVARYLDESYDYVMSLEPK